MTAKKFCLGKTMRARKWLILLRDKKAKRWTLFSEITSGWFVLVVSRWGHFVTIFQSKLTSNLLSGTKSNLLPTSTMGMWESGLGVLCRISGSQYDDICGWKTGRGREWWLTSFARVSASISETASSETVVYCSPRKAPGKNKRLWKF